jgi:hypothetical protein
MYFNTIATVECRGWAMADKHQMSVMLTVETREALRRACEERKCSRSELIEAAVVAFLTPQGHAPSLEVVVRHQEEVRELLAKIIELLEAERHAGEHPPIATYEQMYGPIPEPVPEEDLVPPPLPRRPGFWRRWLFREEG